ncbi:MAG: hypothetical protein K2K25_05815 [Muribaculaceae bacterium]|nr:hypothetical protein [Muribaculaceae bacterium]
MRRILIVIIGLLVSVAYSSAADKSSKMKPRWMTSSLPTPKSSGYFIMSAEGSGKTLAEARQMSFYNLTEELEHERGIIVDSRISGTETEERNSGMTTSSEFTININEKGKRINVTCKVIDEYSEYKNGHYTVTRLYAVNDPAQSGPGMQNDVFKKTTSYGAAPVFYSLIPGVGQLYKGSTVKGSVILGSAVVVGAGIITAESLRASYIKKMKEYPKFHDFYNNKATTWKNVRNVALGVGAGLYVYNLIDAAVAPGRPRVIVSKGKSYNYSLVPTWDGENVALAFTLNF